MNMHLGTGSKNGNRIHVYMHFEVPNTVNLAGLNHRDILIEVLGGDQPSAVLFIESTEQDQLNTGELLEYSFGGFTTHPGEPLQDKLARLDVLYPETKTRVLQELQQRYAAYGHSRNVGD